LREYLLDTDHLSYLQEGHASVAAHLRSLPPQAKVFTSVVNIAELLRGVHLLPAGRRKKELLALYRQILEQMKEVLPITPEVAEQFAEIDARLRRTGKPIPVNDVWVASVARTRSAILVTNDAHFLAVERLVVENWTR
jgi:predicted nucleic acid-binding protein